MPRQLLFLFFIQANLICNAQLLDSLLRADSSFVVRKVMANPEKYRLQLVFSRQSSVESRQLTHHLPLTTHYLGNNPDEYFFPASLVKMPVAAFALEKLHALSVFGIDEFTPILPLSDFQCLGLKKGSNPVPQSINDLIYKVFVYSDNEAYNYLYEFCGQAYINNRLQEMGFANVRIVEKIANCRAEQNRITGSIAFYTNQELFHVEGREDNLKPIQPLKINAKIGKGYLWNGKYIPAPKDFSSANFLSLKDLHTIMMAIHLPNTIPIKQQFRLTSNDLQLLKKAMSTLPSQFFADSCFSKRIPDNSMKYLFGQKDTIPAHFKIYNKVGLAHGFISDCSFFEDSKNGIRFALSAVLYVNEDGILNDGKYEYNSIGIPFLRRLGEIVYQYELRKKSKL